MSDVCEKVAAEFNTHVKVSEVENRARDRSHDELKGRVDAVELDMREIMAQSSITHTAILEVAGSNLEVNKTLLERLNPPEKQNDNTYRWVAGILLAIVVVLIPLALTKGT